MQAQSRLIVGLLLLLSSFGLRAQVGEVFSGEVVGITDGDTIRVMHEGEAVRVRLEGIDCPERSQDFSQRARQLTSSLTFGEVVRVDVRDVDRYGRLVARVVVDGQDVSVALAQQGLAWHYTQYSDDPVLAMAERSAREAEIGLWSRANPIPPWEFRRGGTTSVDEAADGQLHGNRRSRVFHRPGCPNYNCPNCTVLFDSPEEAVAAGFRPAGDCH
jgi:endonuclease YncB( thermonuclease family)